MTSLRLYDWRLKVLMDLTILRASSVKVVRAEAPGPAPFRKLQPGFVVTRVELNGIAELMNGDACDQCERQLSAGDNVLGKIVVSQLERVLSSFFSPTCLSCFMEDRGGYFSTALAALIMEA